MKQIYFNHDGNIDDLVSYLLLLQAPDIKLLGVGAIDADGYIDPSVEACRKMTDLFNLRGDDLTIARSNSRAVNQFLTSGGWQLIHLIIFPCSMKVARLIRSRQSFLLI